MTAKPARGRYYRGVFSRPGSARHGPAQPGGDRSPAADLAVIDCAVYRDGYRTTEVIDYRDAYAQVRRDRSGFVWLGLHAPTSAEMSEIGIVFGLHPLATESMVRTHQRPKLEQYDDTVLLAMRSMAYIDHESVGQANDIIHAGDIVVLVGPDFVITVRHGDHTQLRGVRALLESRPHRLADGPAAVMDAVVDHVVDQYLSVVYAMDPDVDEIEERIFATSTAVLDIDVVYLFKREILELRRAVTPLMGPLAWLSGVELPGATPHIAQPGAFADPEMQHHFRRVRDHLTSAIELINEYGERLTALLNAAATKVNIQQNTDMRKISAWAAVAAVPTMIAGIYGMNFETMPELTWRWSYPTLLAILVAICFGLWRLLHKNGWL